MKKRQRIQDGSFFLAALYTVRLIPTFGKAV